MRSLTTEQDFHNLDIVQVTIKDKTKKHFHRKLTECYYVLKDAIDVEVNGKKEHLDAGSLIMIYPKTIHQAWRTSRRVAEILVICCPPWRAEDEIYD